MTQGTKISLGLGVLAVVVAGGLYMQRGGLEGVTENTDTVAEATTTTTGTPAGKKMAFAEFIKSDKGAYKCTVHQSVKNIETTGTVYISSGLLRGDFNANYAGQKMDIMFIMRDGYTYTWNSMMPTMGYKIKNDTTVAMGDTKASASGQISVSTPNEYLNQIGDYNCEKWSVDASVFSVPGNVTFKAMN